MVLRGFVPATLVVAASITAAPAQQQNPPESQRNPVCVRLEGQLAQVSRGNADPARAEQIKRYEDTARGQQQELDRLMAQARQRGCEGRGFFSIFGGQPPECGPMNNRIQQMRANLDRVLSDLERLRGNSDRDGDRRAILTALGQNDCGPQYRQYANQGGGFFEKLFGGGRGGETIITPGGPPPGNGDTYRTVCVRTCDGFYFPISYSTTPANFQQDAQACQRLCPAAQVQLYSYRNPGEDVAQAVSAEGRPYTELPNAFAYRKQVDPACSCRSPGQSWRDALQKADEGAEPGDIIVTEEQAKILSLPVDSKGRPIMPAQTKGAQKKGAPAAAEAPATPAQPNGEGGKRTVRTVGPPFLPAK